LHNQGLRLLCATTTTSNDEENSFLSGDAASTEAHHLNPAHISYHSSATTKATTAVREPTSECPESPLQLVNSKHNYNINSVASLSPKSDSGSSSLQLSGEAATIEIQIDLNTSPNRSHSSNSNNKSSSYDNCDHKAAIDRIAATKENIDKNNNVNSTSVGEGGRSSASSCFYEDSSSTLTTLAEVEADNRSASLGIMSTSISNSHGNRVNQSNLSNQTGGRNTTSNKSVIIIGNNGNGSSMNMYSSYAGTGVGSTSGYCVDSVEPKCSELKRLIDEFKLGYLAKLNALKLNRSLTKRLSSVS
jgi:hypothetical protein